MVKKSGGKSSPPSDIDTYLASVPDGPRAALQKLREVIAAAAPKAEETISYQIPTFRHMGSLVGFAAFKNHCSFYVMSPALMEEFKDALQSYDTAKGTIHFTAERPLPVALVKKLVKARVAENEARRKRT